MHAHTLDFVIIGFYIFLMGGLSIFASRFTKNTSDYFKVGSKLPWWLAGTSAFMSAFSAWTFTGAAGVAYSDGLVIFSLYAGNVFAFVIGYFLATPWRRTRSITVMQFVGERFDVLTHQSLSWITIPKQIIIGSTWLYALGIFMSGAFNVSVATTILIAGAAIVIYTAIGGFLAVNVIDTAQFIILLPISIIIAIMCVVKLGGIGFLAESGSGQGLQFFTPKYSIIYIIAWFIHSTINYNQAGSATRYFAVKNEREAKRVAKWAAFLFLVGPIFWFIPPIAAKHMLPDLALMFPNLSKPGEASYVAMSLKLLPPGIFGILLTAMFSATMSSLDTSLNRNAGIITRDIYLTIFHKNASEKLLVLLARIFTLVFGASVIILAMFFSRLKGFGVFEIMVQLGALHSIPTGIPLILGLIYKRTPSWSGFFTFTIGLVAATIGKFVYHWTYPEQVLYIAPLCIFLFIVPGLFFKGGEKYKRRRDTFFKKLNTPVDEQKEISYYNIDRISHFQVIGIVTTLLGLFVVIISFFINLNNDRLISIGIGGLYLIIGLILFIFGKIQTKKMKVKYEKQA